MEITTQHTTLAYLTVTDTNDVLHSEAILVNIVAELLARIDSLIEIDIEEEVIRLLAYKSFG